MSSTRLTPQLDVTHCGEEQEFGFALGEALRAKIHAAVSALPQIDSFSIHQPWWMPFSIYQMLAEYRARTMLEPSTKQWYPHMAARLRGMADGADISLESLYLFHMLEVTPIELDGRVLAPPMAGCSAVAVGRNASADGRPMIAHNFDLMPVSRSFFALRKSQREGQLRSLQFSFAALGGTVDGVNEAGLCITYNFAAVCDASSTRPPVSFAIDDALSHARTVPEAVQRITQQPRGGGAILMLADADGNVASLELSGTKHKCRVPKADRDTLLHTNEFQSRCMRRCEPERSSIYGCKSPASLRGRQMFRSPILRRRRLGKLIRRHPKISSDTLRHIMSDHGRSDCGSDDTICMHGGYWSTIASVELSPTSRSLRIAYDAPCQAEYVEFAV